MIAPIITARIIGFSFIYDSIRSLQAVIGLMESVGHASQNFSDQIQKFCAVWCAKASDTKHKNHKNDQFHPLSRMLIVQRNLRVALREVRLADAGSFPNF